MQERWDQPGSGRPFGRRRRPVGAERFEADRERESYDEAVDEAGPGRFYDERDFSSRGDWGAWERQRDAERRGDRFARQQDESNWRERFRGPDWQQPRFAGSDWDPQRGTSAGRDEPEYDRPRHGRAEAEPGWQRGYGVGSEGGYGGGQYGASPRGEYGGPLYGGTGGVGRGGSRFEGGGLGPHVGFGARDWERSQGSHVGKGPKGYRRSDQRVLEDANDALERHPEIDASDIEVVCRDGEIALRGTVSTRYEKHLAEQAIEDLPGVRDVRNEIRVQSQSSSGARPGSPRASDETQSPSQRERSETAHS